MIKNILFDMGQVLIYFNPPKMIEKFNLSAEDSLILYQEVFKQKEWLALDDGTMSEQQAIDNICSRLSRHLHPFVRLLVNDWWKEDFDNVPGMEQLLKDLKNNGYKLYLLSNASIRQNEYFSKIAGSEFFDGRVTSANCHCIKPEKQVFDYLISTYGLKKEECIFIDDTNLNAYCAQKYGIKSIVFLDDVNRLRKDLIEFGVCLD